MWLRSGASRPPHRGQRGHGDEFAGAQVEVTGDVRVAEAELDQHPLGRGDHRGAEAAVLRQRADEARLSRRLRYLHRLAHRVAQHAELRRRDSTTSAGRIQRSSSNP
jgi:hypothetical protein